MISKLANAIDKANKIVFFSGAGMSTDSGIPDFRSSEGLYNQNLKAEQIVSHSFFMKNPKAFYDFYKNKMVFKDAKPNYGHYFIAELEKEKDVTVITQNIDGLHQQAGSSKVIELHGSIHKNRCLKCLRPYPLEKIITSNDVPYCDCGGIIKPEVVLYEEALDEEVIEKAIISIYQADLLIILGTSLMVYPAAGFIRYFKGNNLAIINKSTTAQDGNCDITIHDSISDTFKKIKELR